VYPGVGALLLALPLVAAAPVEAAAAVGLNEDSSLPAISPAAFPARPLLAPHLPLPAGRSLLRGLPEPAEGLQSPPFSFLGWGRLAQAAAKARSKRSTV
jgi:hypothetical protein